MTTPEPSGPSDTANKQTSSPDQAQSAEPASRQVTQPAGYHLRVSTQERERVAAHLSNALSGGRLTPAEFDERSQLCYTATIYADLIPLLADLTQNPVAVINPAAEAVPPQNLLSAGTLQAYPAERDPAEGPNSGQVQSHIGANGLDTRIGGTSSGPTTSFAFFGDTVRSGQWTVPARYYTFAQFGDNLLDLRQARFADRNTRIQCYTMFGDVEVIVPPDITVHVSGFGIFGSVGGLSQTGPPGCPEVTISGYTLFGDITARLRTKKEQKQLRKQEWRDRKGLGR